MCLRLHHDAAPDAVDQLVAQVEAGRFDGLTIDYTRPRVEVRTSDIPGAEDVPATIDASSLGLDTKRIADRGEAMNVMQDKLLPAYRSALRGKPLTPLLETWLAEWFDGYDPSFLVGTSYQQVYEALGYVYTPGLASRPVTRGSVALVPRGPGMASERLSIALSDLAHRDGRWMVVGEVIGGLDLVERIALAPLATPPNSKPVGYVPRDPVEIDAVHGECAPRASLLSAHQGEIR